MFYNKSFQSRNSSNALYNFNIKFLLVCNPSPRKEIRESRGEKYLFIIIPSFQIYSKKSMTEKNITTSIFIENKKKITPKQMK